MGDRQLTPRRQFLNNSRAEQHSDALRSGKAWLATQRMLKRTGRILVSDKAGPKAPGSVFNFYDIRDLYLLQLAANWIKNAAGISSWVEVSSVQRAGSHQLSLEAQYMIIPRSIRRKVDAFRQINTTKKIPVQEFKGSLYFALCQISGSKAAANEKLLTLPVTQEEIRKITEPDIKIYGYIGKTIAPVFMLFMLECQRLGYSMEYRDLRRLRYFIKDHNELNMLGYSLYFAFLYLDAGDYFTRFFIEYNNVLKDAVKKRELIQLFILDIHTRYLYTANKRNYLKRKKRDGQSDSFIHV
ncbi:hypothetical protein CSN29_26285 [Salmonella enterica subsp. diarizonae]|nr:hypothetical protein [Salmonella enterica]ECC3884277.1 hypothetical protein [Salmonella enterica subsp. diarizonae]ECJ4781695.1 hypothetical protein [Salmonella enterica subsp. diarizonae]EDQ7409356.1 hypothetical protein [Salmonella enterica subsp. diarizonae]EKG3508547.1 hypothetical protein [Salmonella enterica]